MADQPPHVGLQDVLFHPEGTGERRKPERPAESGLFRYIFHRDRGAAETVQSFLSRQPLFDTLTHKELRKVAAIVHERTYAPGELIYEQGTPGAAMYLIRKGSVELFRQDEAGRESARLALLREGTFFGEGALFEENLRFTSARSLEQTDTLSFFRADLDQLIARLPTTGNKLLRKLAWVASRRLQVVMEETYRGKQP